MMARGCKGNGNYWPVIPNYLYLEPFANSDIRLVVIIDLLFLKNITKTAINGSK